jgi:hypothetical protein
MPGGKRLIGLIALIVVVVLVAAARFAHHRTSNTEPSWDGPLAGGVVAQGGAFVFRVGEPTTFGGIIPIVNESHDPVVIDDVEAYRASPSGGLRILGALIGFPSGATWGGAIHWPPGKPWRTKHFGPTAPLRGFQLDPKGTGNAIHQGQILVGLVSTAARKKTTVDGWIVDYHQGAHPYRLWYPYAMVVCSYPQGHRNRCAEVPEFGLAERQHP